MYGHLILWFLSFLAWKMLREGTQSSFYSWKHLQHDSEGEPCFHALNSYTKFSNSSTYIFLFRLLIFCDTYINIVSFRCKNMSTAQSYETCSMYLCSESSFKIYIGIAFSPDVWVQLHVHMAPALSWRKFTDAVLWKCTFDNI